MKVRMLATTPADTQISFRPEIPLLEHTASVRHSCCQSPEGACSGRAVFAALLNPAMQVERDQEPQAAPDQRTIDRQGCANGVKPKALKIRIGLGPAACLSSPI